MKTLKYILHVSGLSFYPEFCLPAPGVKTRQRADKRQDTDGEVGRHGRKTNVTEDRIQDTSGTIAWDDTTDKVGKDTTRTATFTETDRQILSLDKYSSLDIDKYRILKTIWAANVSAEKAGEDYRVKNMQGAGTTIRKLYWSAFNAGHKMSKEKRGEAV